MNFNTNSLPVWTDIVDSSNYETIKNEKNIIESKVSINFPPELMEKIATYLDGRSLIAFKLVSKSCNVVASNAVLYNKMWKKFCLNDIPSKYFQEMLKKRFTDINLFGESDYENLFKGWLLWQKPKFKVSLIFEETFLINGICSLLAYQDELIVVTDYSYCPYILKRNNLTNKVELIKKQQSQLHRSIYLLALNPRLQCAEANNDAKYNWLNRKGPNVCPLQSQGSTSHTGIPIARFGGQLLSVDVNPYEEKCCWIRQSWYGYYSHSPLKKLHEHYCDRLSSTVFSSVIHQLVIGRMTNNYISVHDMNRDECMVVPLWLNIKYMEATAIFIYTNMLFVGTRNSYLVVYRLNNWNDLLKPKESNILLDVHLSMGPILAIEILDYKNHKTIVVAARSRIVWLNVL
ncbi:uncharacterized protein LOC126836610 [Adelges cooleyi]|uniref:uncharacterized protein LOC126836610 n=1 Tax=Adelges cooleyi TaxID=133065 RepID=UPI00217F8069|nr:uncharacterized protein LOC126836610 [Adelges cooleyi]XP_050426127.1 uncharacterized protein LOC126836610 [Adelges cooleyi]